MYNLTDIRAVHLEVTSRCQASCPMCVRNHNGGVENHWLKLDEITLEQFKQWFPVEFIQQLDRLYMCGNTGDPIVARDTLSIFKYLRETNPNIQLSMNTNGSAKTSEWWEELAKTDVKVRFGIDGLADTHSLYRIGTNWHKIIENAMAFIRAGGYAIWDMLVFEHNIHQLPGCECMSQQMGFKEFVVKHTSRFNNNESIVLDKDGSISHIIRPSLQSQEFVVKFSKYNIQENKIIHCKVQKEKSMYVSANGNIAACCWLDFNAVRPFNASYADFRTRGFVNLNLKTQSLQEIFNSDYFTKIKDTWDHNPLLQCSKQCGKIDKFNEQYEK